MQAQANLNAKDEDLQQLQATLTAKDIEVQQLHNGIDNLQAQLALQTRSIQQPKAHHQQVVKKDRVIHHLTATVEQLQDETAKADSKLEQLHHDILLKDRALVDSNTQLQQLQNDFRKDEAAADRDMQLQELKSDLLQRDNSLADRNWEVQQLKIALLRKEEAHKFTKESSHKEMQLLRFNFQSKRKALADRDMQMQQLHDELCQTDSILADTEVEVHELKHDHSWTEKSLSDLQLAYNDKSNLVAQKDDIIQQLLTERHYNLANQAQLSESRASIAKLEVEKDEQIAHLIRANDTAEDLARDHMQLGQHYRYASLRLLF